MKSFIRMFGILTAAAILTGCASTSELAAQNIVPSAEAHQESSSITSVKEVEAKHSANRFDDYDFDSYSEAIQYNENPDTASKPIPSGYSYADYSEPLNTAHLLKSSENAVIVHILDGSEVVEYSLTGNNELDKAIADKTGNSSFATIETELVRAEVQYSVYGEHKEGDIVNISMYDKIWGMELITGRDYLVLTKHMNKDNRPDIFNIPNGINGIYEIKDDFTVVAQSFMRECSKYDGLSLADIVHDFAVNNEIRMERLKAEEESLIIE